MSSADIALVSQEMTQRIHAGESKAACSVTLNPGELLRIQRGARILDIVSGAAWITGDGTDTVASRGERVSLGRTRHPVLVSGLGGRPLCFEVR